jgi:hypothetical protein
MLELVAVKNKTIPKNDLEVFATIIRPLTEFLDQK